jgi:hypothetical protein
MPIVISCSEFAGSLVVGWWHPCRTLELDVRDEGPQFQFQEEKGDHNDKGEGNPSTILASGPHRPEWNQGDVVARRVCERDTRDAAGHRVTGEVTYSAESAAAPRRSASRTKN